MPPTAAAVHDAELEARLASRARRVTALVGVVALASMLDLHLTLVYLHSGGFSEGNPLARWVMQAGCPWLLGAWKIGMVLLTCGLLLIARRRVSGEIGAWVCVAILSWLGLQWSAYAESVPQYTRVLTQLARVEETWVSYPR